jgi:hypothetical protein
MSRLIEWLGHRRDVVGFETWKDLSEFSGLSLQTLDQVQLEGSVEFLNRSDRRALAGALRVSLRKLEQLDDCTIDWIEDDYFYDASARGRPLPRYDDDPAYWIPKETKAEDRGTPLIGRIRDGGKAEPDEDWQEDWGRRIPKRFGSGHDIYALELDASGQSIVLRNIPVWEFREGLAAVYCWNGWEAEGWFGRVYLAPSKARVVTADGTRHDLDLLSVVRIGTIVGRWPNCSLQTGDGNS